MKLDDGAALSRLRASSRRPRARACASASGPSRSASSSVRRCRPRCETVMVVGPELQLVVRTADRREGREPAAPRRRRGLSCLEPGDKVGLSSSRLARGLLSWPRRRRCSRTRNRMNDERRLRSRHETRSSTQGEAHDERARRQIRSTSSRTSRGREEIGRATLAPAAAASAAASPRQGLALGRGPAAHGGDRRARRSSEDKLVIGN